MSLSDSASTQPGPSNSKMGSKQGQQQQQEGSTSPGGDADNEAAADPPLWRLDWQQRWQCFDSWLAAARQDWAAELAEIVERLDEINRQLRSLEDEPKEGVLARARVIGCTTTGDGNGLWANIS